MRPFQILRPATLEEARAALGGSAVSMIVAGGTDIMGEMQEGTVSPDTLVSIDGVRGPDGMDGIEVSDDGASIGSLATLAEIASNPAISRLYPALAEAAASVATPQIRNVGTLGGNLSQRPRCWYYRSPNFSCLKRGGDTCYAVDGLNKYHAIFGSGGCHIVHPSDTAVALLALDASIEVFGEIYGEIHGEVGTRAMPASSFFVTPDVDMTRETALRDGEIITRATLPPPDGAKSVYLKAKERQAYDFALVSVAGMMRVQDGVVTDARFALGGVAPVPYAPPALGDALVGARASAIDPTEIGGMATLGARPMSDNGYKVRLASNLVARATEALLA